MEGDLRLWGRCLEYAFLLMASLTTKLCYTLHHLDLCYSKIWTILGWCRFFFCLKTLVFLFVYLSTLVYSLYLKKKLEHISYLPFSDSFDYFGLLRGRFGWVCKHLIPRRVWSGLSLATLASPAYIWI